MRTVELLIDVPGRDVDEVYSALADFERYPELAAAVHSVTVTRITDAVTRSTWEVAFRAGVLRWTEEDRFDPAARTIDFHQTEGDIALFEGTWRCVAGGEGTRILFRARLDMGIPSLADALEPIAVRTLVDNTVGIVDGLMGGARLVDSVVASPADQDDARRARAAS
jgi:ribosome-associated toxin RatA of RatAB toxin-antitoxin module